MPHKSVVAIICVTIVLVVALLKNIDGAMLVSGTAVIAGLGGFAIGKKKLS